MLMSVGLPLPRTIFGHGFVQAADGSKMSKSTGNVINPTDVIKQYGSDSVRLFMARGATYVAHCYPASTSPCILVPNAPAIRANCAKHLVLVAQHTRYWHPNRLVPGNWVKWIQHCIIHPSRRIVGRYGADLGCAKNVLEDFHNADLVKNVGNLCHRAVTLAGSMCGGVVPAVPVDVVFDLKATLGAIDEAMRGFEISEFVDKVLAVSRDLNKYLADKEPWKMDKDEVVKKQIVVRSTLEGVYILAHLLEPVVPDGAARQRLLLPLEGDSSQSPRT